MYWYLFIGSLVVYFTLCALLTLNRSSKSSLKRLSNDQLASLKLSMLKQHLVAKKTKSYGSMGNTAEVCFKIEKEFGKRGVHSVSKTPALKLVSKNVRDIRIEHPTPIAV